MKLKKWNAALALLSILAMLVHIGYSVFAYLTFYYNPALKLITAIPFMVLVCLHAVCGMLTVFLQADGTRLVQYPGKNRQTLIQRVSAALIFPLLILHLTTFSLLQSTAESGQWGFFALLILAEIAFFGVVIAHVAVSFSKALITLGILSSAKAQKRLDLVMYILGAAVFVCAVVSVVKGQAAMFIHL